MNRHKTVIVSVVAVVAVVVIALAVGYMIANRPLVTALEGGIPLDNEIDTAEVKTFVVDEAGILSEKTEKIVSIYNAHWKNLAGSEGVQAGVRGFVQRRFREPARRVCQQSYLHERQGR